MVKLFYGIVGSVLSGGFLLASLTGWQIFSLNSHHFRMPMGPMARPGIHHK
jgi:hypothetical protein